MSETITAKNFLDPSSEILIIKKSLNLREIIPLSFQQEEIWYTQLTCKQIELANNRLMTFPLAADTCPAALRTAFNSVVARHEALRTTFFTDPQGRPAQRIAGALD
ncbi:condensation domain-containing protein, partial [Photorhabdus heterorhabditis]|uniref:condensation domain-containing protein n=1 Tax=Photorhabdus heterorhabditis TaxID=880156 RepID=UPI0015626C29